MLIPGKSFQDVLFAMGKFIVQAKLTESINLFGFNLAQGLTLINRMD